MRALLVLPLLAFASIPAVARADPLEVHRETLPNGLRVVFAADHTSPTVGVCVAYDVGGRDEDAAHAGYAHLLEHFMFQGSRQVAAGAHYALVAARGGLLDALTTVDHATFAELLPSSELALGLWLEADRMKSLSLSAAALEDQRAVVRAEYRRAMLAPYALATQKLRELVYDDDFPYAHDSLAAAAADGATVDIAQLRAFHQAYYGPSNAVLAIAGDIETEDAVRLASRFFEGARGSDAPKRSAASLAEPTAPREAVVEDARAPLPALLYGWALPPARDKDHPALELLAIVLGDGEASRLHRALVHEQGLAAEVHAETEGQRGPDLFTVSIKMERGPASTLESRLSKTERLLVAELRTLAKQGPSEAELARARSRRKGRALFGLESNIQRARALAELTLDDADPPTFPPDDSAFGAVTREDVKRVALAYLAESRWSRVEVKVPPAPPPTAGER